MVVDNNILEVENLTVSFDGRAVAERLSYTLGRGRTLGIVGESGSGKSVSTLALMGLLPQNATVEGHAWLSGKSDSVGRSDLLSLDEEGFRSIRGRRIAMVFQEPMTSLNPVQKCGQQVMEMLCRGKKLKAKGERERVIELFREVLLPRPEKIFDSYPHELSGGQKQRVMIAMALINKPDIIVADEPTTALDVTVQRTILDLLKQLQERHGVSIIFISHDLGVISQIADDIMVMYRGRIVEQGVAAEVLHHPQQLYTRGLLACRPPLDSRPHRLPTVEEFLSSNGATGLRELEKLKKLKESKTLPKNSKLIEVRNLTVTYPLKKNFFGKVTETLTAVDGLTFDIREGETLGLVGESGCGKSTLGRALLRLIDHSDGKIIYRGTPLSSLSNSQMRALRPKLQIVFQDPYSSLNPRITVGEAIAEPLRVHKGGDRERVCALMQQVGLAPEWYNRYPHELSGGQRQRVCIARALVLHPELVVCDESVSALDVSIQAQVLNLLSDLKEQYGFTCLFITHDLAVAHYFSDRIMVMQHGRIVEEGSPEEIFSNPQTAYTQTLINAIPQII